MGHCRNNLLCAIGKSPSANVRFTASLPNVGRKQETILNAQSIFRVVASDQAV
ncbi:hypothetical protein QUF90_06565 [Desulfococcaceae bacterium HSG9]|nr:hypothetical protein [Desulfococcaceae bacterium HSG9]